MFVEHQDLIDSFLKGLQLTSRLNAVMAVLDAIEHLCKFDVDLNLREERFKDEIEASVNFRFL